MPWDSISSGCKRRFLTLRTCDGEAIRRPWRQKRTAGLHSSPRRSSSIGFAVQQSHVGRSTPTRRPHQPRDRLQDGRSDAMSIV